MEYKKIYLLIIICLFSVGVSAQSGTEKISLSFKNIPLKEAMEKLRRPRGILSFMMQLKQMWNKLSV